MWNSPSLGIVSLIEPSQVQQKEVLLHSENFAQICTISSKYINIGIGWSTPSHAQYMHLAHEHLASKQLSYNGGILWLIQTMTNSDPQLSARCFSAARA